jgi:aminodeoxyfutalosine synthase
MLKRISFIEDALIKAGQPLADIGKKVINGERLTGDEGLALYQSNNLGLLGILACHVKQRHSGNNIYYNRNFHIEPSNICIHHCRFCSYIRTKGDSEAWERSIDQITELAKRHGLPGITEVHITGSVHPSHDVYYYAGMLQAIRSVLPEIHIKAFSAVELDHMFAKAGVSDSEGFEILRKAGLQSIPGGGAEIFNEPIRQEICPEKTGSQRWLDIHHAAHLSGLTSNATMLYGHIEHYTHRIDHLQRIRNLQDQTGGFNAFIPLKYRMAGNPMTATGETTIVEDMKNYAVSRIFLDNIPHIKAYWPMAGREMAQIALAFGADDIDGTISDTTKIYAMAGADDTHPATTVTELRNLITSAGYQPVERNSLYQPL